MAGLRVILGILEAGFFPGCVYLLSTWYTRCKGKDSSVGRYEVSLADKWLILVGSLSPSPTNITF